MKITKNNYTIVPSKEQTLLLTLLEDVSDINRHIKHPIYIDWQDFHNEYSPERIEPCPDYYGAYSLRFEHRDYALIGSLKTIEDLDESIYIISSFIALIDEEL